MKRLTKEEVYECATSVITTNLGRVCGKTLSNQIVKELLEYKAIEEELGIDLITLFKARKDGAYFKNPYRKNRIDHIESYQIKFDFGHLRFDIRMSAFVEALAYSTGGALFYFKDYGKTWALTKEEL